MGLRNGVGARPEGMHYIPYIGTNYQDGFAKGLKLLILGDSHHSGTDQRTAASDAITDYIRGESYPFFDRIQQTVTGDPAKSEGERRAFWEKVAFTNLIQESMGASSEAPTKAQWEFAWNCFPEMVSFARPDLLFCFTRRGWNIQAKFNSVFSGENLYNIQTANDYAYLYDFSNIAPGYKAVAGCFNHPSSRGYRPDDWHPWAELLLQHASSALYKDLPHKDPS